jgi:hypothetical protein
MHTDFAYGQIILPVKGEALAAWMPDAPDHAGVPSSTIFFASMGRMAANKSVWYGLSTEFQST